MSKWKNNKVDECFVKDSTNARMAFINTFKGVLRHKDKEHLEKYEKLWDLHDHDYSYYLRSNYHNISKDEFADMVFILCASHYAMSCANTHPFRGGMTAGCHPRTGD